MTSKRPSKTPSELSVAPSLDPEEEAFKALSSTICAMCRKRGITSKDDVRLIEMVNKYSNLFPQLTTGLIERELKTHRAPTAMDRMEISELNSLAASAVEVFKLPTDVNESNESFDENKLNRYISRMRTESNTSEVTDDDGHEEQGNKAIAGAQAKKPSCFSNFKGMCKENHGYNLTTYALLLSSLVVLMFLTSVISTYLNYNQGSYRDWALAGGVTSTSAQFRVRGPASDDGFSREFVVSSNPNLAIEKDQMLNTPVSYGDFDEEEHFVKRLEITNLSPSTTYYYGITRPKITPNSAVVAGDVVGKFTTPAPEGQRMDFTIATGSCALTGSKSDMFSSVLDLDPLLFIHMGDFHYEDLNTLDIDERLTAYDKVMGSPSQRQLYMQTIFSYIWDDHDWLGNNEDADYESKAGEVAKQTYTIGIPHYELGSTSTSEANAAKYQAFTIGTVRFIITDLRSESIRSSEYYSGRVYSKEQKEWLYNELSQAENYDFVVWVTTRPWTDPEKAGSDSWGGFASDRDELSAHIASTIGAGPKNLFVLSGDNHMVAYDDGSSTDYSGQDYYPGGFPLLHSGPMTNFGSGVADFFNPNTNYYTDGCMAFNSEVNHQFSTIDFSFPSDSYDDDDWWEEGCIRIRSYSGDSSNVIFEKEMCGEIMRYGTPEQDTCTLKKLSVPTQSLFIVAAILIVLMGMLALWFLGMHRCQIALTFFGFGILYYLLTIAAAIAGAFCFGTLGVNMFAVSVFVLLQAVLGCIFEAKSVYGYCNTCEKCETDKEAKSNVGDNEMEASAETTEMEASQKQPDDDANLEPIEEDGAATQDEMYDDAPAPLETSSDIKGSFRDAVVSPTSALSTLRRSLDDVEKRIAAVIAGDSFLTDVEQGTIKEEEEDEEDDDEAERGLNELVSMTSNDILSELKADEDQSIIPSPPKETQEGVVGGLQSNPESSGTAPTLVDPTDTNDVYFRSTAMGIKLKRCEDGFVRVLTVTEETLGSPIIRDGRIEPDDRILEAAGVDLRKPITNAQWGDIALGIRNSPRPMKFVVAGGPNRQRIEV